MEEFREVIYFALACMGAAIVLTVYSAFGSLTADMADVRHEEIQEQSHLDFERIYGVYHEQELSGMEVIALLRENAMRDARCTIIIDRNASGNPMEQSIDNYGNFTLTALVSLIHADSTYAAVVEGDTIHLTRR